MSTEWKAPMEWANAGTAPSDTLKATGFKAGNKPPAAIFNYFLHRMQECIEQLQSVADTHTHEESEIIGLEADLGSMASQISQLISWNDVKGAIKNGSGAKSLILNEGSAADGADSIAGGYCTIANAYQAVFGKGNVSSAGPTGWNDVSGDIFIIGGGTDDDTRFNALRVTTEGKAYGQKAFGSAGADYAEMFEYSDENAEGEDRRGLMVTLEGDKIRLSKAGDNILGIISTTASFLGDTASEDWHDKYLRDVFGEKITETVEVPEKTVEKNIEKFNEETGETITETIIETIPAHIEKRWVLNPEYNPDEKYIPREERSEWGTVGLLGKVVAVDDGSCKVGEYCTASEKGILTYSTEKTKFYCMKRIDDTHIKVFIGA